MPDSHMLISPLQCTAHQWRTVRLEVNAMGLMCWFRGAHASTALAGVDGLPIALPCLALCFLLFSYQKSLKSLKSGCSHKVRVAVTDCLISCLKVSKCLQPWPTAEKSSQTSFLSAGILTPKTKFWKPLVMPCRSARTKSKRLGGSAMFSASGLDWIGSLHYKLPEEQGG